MMPLKVTLLLAAVTSPFAVRATPLPAVRNGSKMGLAYVSLG